MDMAENHDLQSVTITAQPLPQVATVMPPRTSSIGSISVRATTPPGDLHPSLTRQNSAVSLVSQRYDTSTSSPKSVHQSLSRAHSLNLQTATSSLGNKVMTLTDNNKENVQVTVRMRPLTTAELKSNIIVGWEVAEKLAKIVPVDAALENAKKPATSVLAASPEYTFDHTFQGSANKSLYDTAVRQLVYSTMKGYNGTVFAYGQTSSGKTYTMMGTKAEPGVIPQAVHDVFQFIKSSEGQREYLLRVSYMEIYNETIRDLLAPDSRDLRVHEDKKRGVYVSPLKEEIVTSPNQVVQIISRGESNRHISTTDYNEHSSRSHTLFQMVIESREAGSHLRKNSTVKISLLNLIDLAGSEKAASNVERRKEGSYINKSLLTLGTVIAKLTEEKMSHVPYRDSKLTRILQSSLSGNARVSVICTISPSANNMEESISTLKFAARVKKIVTRAHTNHIMDDKALLQQYRKEIQELKDKLAKTSEAFERERQEEMKQIKAEKEKYEEELHEQQVLRTALKDRIGHLTRLILTSGSLTQGHASASPDIAKVSNPFDDPLMLSNTLSPMPIDLVTSKLVEKNAEISQLASQVRELQDHISLSVATSKLSINNILEETPPLMLAHSHGSSVESLDINAEIVSLKQCNRELEIVAEDAEERFALLVADYERDQETWQLQRTAYTEELQQLRAQLTQMQAQIQAHKVERFELVETQIIAQERDKATEASKSELQDGLEKCRNQISALENELVLTKAELNVARMNTIF